MSDTPIILLVEDNDDDAELTERAFRKARIDNPMLRMRDGVEALDYVLAKGPHAGRDIRDVPAIILLDLNMPRLDGIDVLKAIRANEHVKHVPIVILTSSLEDKDRLAAYDSHANSYVRKPINHQDFVAAARELGMYWLVLNQPPPRKR